VKSIHSKYTPQLKDIVGDMMYTSKTAESSRIARAIADRASRQAEALNRGARSCRFFVVRNTLMPAVLVEVGFLTNRQEEKKLKSGAYRQRMAEAIARSIIDYANDS
jgi:N-acetylmuramoyl-L-alanine amidase